MTEQEKLIFLHHQSKGERSSLLGILCDAFQKGLEQPNVSGDSRGTNSTYLLNMIYLCEKCLIKMITNQVVLKT